ncbi:hypothetical protein BU16DRAFT_523685 [Lophium mytilinum]|uniref:Zn(2)-C6 fungal-type domain-containing protein n=1 Tax=Lophium mytilinum TaxID=390894 RepID=A0A6A6R4F2_9PEZI|nr:hypothetical protein BU16DRAFT_523685 [Lophium mytilinum]
MQPKPAFVEDLESTSSDTSPPTPSTDGTAKMASPQPSSQLNGPTMPSVAGVTNDEANHVTKTTVGADGVNQGQFLPMACDTCHSAGIQCSGGGEKCTECAKDGMPCHYSDRAGGPSQNIASHPAAAGCGQGITGAMSGANSTLSSAPMQSKHAENTLLPSLMQSKHAASKPESKVKPAPQTHDRQPGGGLFGDPSNPKRGLSGLPPGASRGRQSGGGLFGSGASRDNQGQGGGLFGGFGALSKPSTGTQSGGGLFGSAFGAPSRASTGQQSGGGLFGSTVGAPSTASTGRQSGGGLFTSRENQGQGQSSGGLFGTPSTVSTGQQSGGGLFGSAVSRDRQGQGGGLFGGFGAPSTASAGQRSGGGLFGTPSTVAAGRQSGGGLFGSAAPREYHGQGVFGAFSSYAPTNAAQSSGLFGGQQPGSRFGYSSGSELNDGQAQYQAGTGFGGFRTSMQSALEVDQEREARMKAAQLQFRRFGTPYDSYGPHYGAFSGQGYGGHGHQSSNLFGQGQTRPQVGEWSIPLASCQPLYSSDFFREQHSSNFGGSNTTPLMPHRGVPSSGIFQSQPTTSANSGVAPVRVGPPGKKNELKDDHPKDSFLQLLQTGKYSDYTITTKAHKWNVHMAVIASKAGDLIPKDAASGGTVRYERWDRIVMDRVIEFIYSGDYDTYVEPDTTADVKFGFTIDPLTKRKLSLLEHLCIFAAGMGYEIPGLAELTLEKVKQYFEGSKFVEAEVRSAYKCSTNMGILHDFQPYLPANIAMGPAVRMCDCLRDVAIAHGLPASAFH